MKMYPPPSQVSFEIGITSTKCPSDINPTTVKIRPLGFNEDVEIELNFICECECHDHGEANSTNCHNGNGTFECGACRYSPPPALHLTRWMKGSAECGYCVDVYCP